MAASRENRGKRGESKGLYRRILWAVIPLLMSVLSAGGRPAVAGVGRIVSLAPSVTEILFALGVGDRVVGVSTHCDYPPQVAGRTRIGTFLSPNVERILAQKPDLVIGVPSPGNRTSVADMQGLGLRVLVVAPEGVASILASIRAVADAVGVPAEGERLVEELQRDLQRIGAVVATASPRRVLMLVGREPLVAVGAGSYLDELLRLAQATNVAATAQGRWPNVGLEFVLDAAPEVIIDAAMGSERTDDDARQTFWASFPVIPAVRDGRVYGYPRLELLRPGPRVAQALEGIAQVVHPEVFSAGVVVSQPSRDLRHRSRPRGREQ